MTDTMQDTDNRSTLEDALDNYSAETWGKPLYTCSSYGYDRTSYFYRCFSWDSISYFEIFTGYANRMTAIIDEAYATNEKRKSHVNAPLTSETDEAMAERQAVALNATSTQREKLRELVTARRDAELEVTRLRAALALANEPIESAADSRLVPIWVQAARAASTAGHCGEYDELASNIGALDRDDLSSMGYATRDGARLDIEVTFTVTVDVDNWDDWQNEDYEELAFEVISENLGSGDASYAVIEASRIDASELD